MHCVRLQNDTRRTYICMRVVCECECVGVHCLSQKQYTKLLGYNHHHYLYMYSIYGGVLMKAYSCAAMSVVDDDDVWYGW